MILQEKYIVLQEDKVLTWKGFKPFQSHALHNSQVRLFNSKSDAEYYISKYSSSRIELVKVRVKIEVIDDEQ